ncbi:hypothetical protein HHI36_010284, partial [Cryptolaemus montrouzieri]
MWQDITCPNAVCKRVTQTRFALTLRSRFYSPPLTIATHSYNEFQGQNQKIHAN